MRNLKKFLALVLAMLMVSACAVSVAAFTDDAAVEASDYTTAIKELASMGIINGTGNGAYEPDGTLRRDAAAKIAAMLLAGGKNIDFTATTACVFDDVTAKWSFGYINYAADRGAMVGTGNGFEPAKTLTIAEAVAIGIQMLGLKPYVAFLNGDTTPTPWYVNYIDVAEKAGLLTNIDPISYAEPCSRGMMAQIAYNAINATTAAPTIPVTYRVANKIQAAFGITPVTVTVTKVTTDGVVETKDSFGTVYKFNEAAFNEASTIKAADLVDSQVTITYSTVTATGKIYRVEVLSDVGTFDYTDGFAASVKDHDEQIKLGDKTYILSGSTGSTASGVIGSSLTTTYRVNVYVNGSTTATTSYKTLPEYYTAVTFDDNKDGAIDRINVTEYKIATIAKDGTLDNGGADGKTKVDKIVVSYLDGTKITNNDDGKKYAVNVPESIKFDKTPVLCRWIAGNSETKVNTLDVLKIAEKKTGTLTNIATKDKYLVLGSEKYVFVTGTTTPDAWTMGQTVSIYTLDGKYVAVAEGDSKSTLTVAVDKVVVKDGKAVITGFDVADGFKDVTYTIEGIKQNDKLISKTAYAHSFTDTDEKVYERAVTIAETKDGKESTVLYTLNEGDIYELTKTADGIYVEKYVDSLATYGKSNLTNKIIIDGSFIYSVVGDTKTKEFKNGGIVIFTPVPEKSTTAVKYNEYAQTYVKTSTFTSEKAANIQIKADKDSVANFVYVVNAGKTAGTTITSATSLVQILEEYEYGLDFYLYHAVDLLTGKVVDVKSAAKVTAGDYYITVDNVVSDANGFGALWMQSKTVTAAKPDKFTTTITANPINLFKDDVDGATWVPVAKKAATYDADTNIVWYKADATGMITVKDGAAEKNTVGDLTKTLTVGETKTYTFVSYIVDGKMILVGDAK